MRRRRKVVVGALGAVAALVLAACGGGNVASSGGSGGGSGGGGGNADAQRRRTTRPTQKGGTLRMANSGDWDSLDPADTYYGYVVELRPALRPVAGDVQVGARQGRRQLVPDLAASLGKSSPTTPRPGPTRCARASSSRTARPSRARTSSTPSSARWTRRRSRTVPTYFNDFLDLQGYTTPYKDTDPNKLGLKAIETPDDQTIVFHLKKPFSGFDYFALLPVHHPGAAGEGHRQRSTRSTWSPPARTCSRPTTWARTSRSCATRTGTRRPTRTASRCPTASRCSSTSTPTTSTTGCCPVTSTSTSRARASAARRKVVCWPTRRSRRTPTPR